MKLKFNSNFIGIRKIQETIKGILIILACTIFFVFLILSFMPHIIHVQHEPEKFFLGRVTCCLKINDNFKLEVEKADGKKVVAFSKKMVDVGIIVKVGPGLEINCNVPIPTHHRPRSVNLPIRKNPFYIPGLIPPD